MRRTLLIGLCIAANGTLARPAPGASQSSREDRGETLGQSAELSFWTVGSGVEERFGPSLFEVLEGDHAAVDAVLLSIADGPLPQRSIQERTGLTPSRLEAILAQLQGLRVIDVAADGRWSTTLPVVSDAQMARLKEVLRPVAAAVAERMSRMTSALSARYEEVKGPEDPPWEAVSHLMVDKFIIDGTFHGAIGDRETARGLDSLYSEGQQLIPAFYMERGESFSTFGSNWYPYVLDGDQREVYVIHGSVLHRYDIRMNRYRGDPEFRRALFALAPDGGTGSLSAADREIFRSLEWIDGDHFLVPTVRAETVKTLWPLLEEIGGAGADVVFDDFGLILEANEDFPYSEFVEGAGDFIQVCYHVLFGLTLEELARTGAISGYPDPTPEHFGAYIVMGKLF